MADEKKLIADLGVETSQLASSVQSLMGALVALLAQ